MQEIKETEELQTEIEQDVVDEKSSVDTQSAQSVLERTAQEEIATAEATIDGVLDGTLDGALGDETIVPVGGKVKKRSGFAYGAYLFFKRAFDIVSSGLMMIILSPVILICLLIKFFEDFHNPIYVSERVGKDGKVFKFFKIRTMVLNAEDMKQELIDKDLNEADGPVFKMENDPRITPFGRFLRKTSLDELPQLLNIFLGNMSVVGPRPPIPCEVEKYDEYQKQRLEIKGGLLCLWQVQKNRHSLSFEDWVRLDLEYIEKQSILLDLKIIFVGFFMILFDRSGH